MISRIIHFSIQNKFIIGLFTIFLIGWGAWSLIHLPVDAIPDITNNQVQIISLAPSLAVQEVESFITAPIEVAVASIPDIVELRSISRLGLSVVTVVFKDNTDVYWARQQLSERLKEAEEDIPPGLARIELAPISTGLGEIYQYRLVAMNGKYNSMELRTIQDWIVRREMLGTSGVADINSYGGFVRQYEIAVNPEHLKGMGLTLTDIFQALQNNNENTGSAYIDKKPTAWFIRGIGLVRTLEDIGKIVVKVNSTGVPLLIRDIGTVQYGSATRYGAFVVDTAEAVGGVVMMLKGANAREVVSNVEQRIESIRPSLPEGVTIEPYLNRSDLVGRSIHTVSENLLLGALIVVFILVLMLGNLRAGLIVASVIPLSMLFAVSIMKLFGISGNLMSLGAIDFGLIVDGAVIIVESVVHQIDRIRKENGNFLRFNRQQMDENVYESAKKMMSSATFGQIIILVVYLPILALVGIEGKMFRPMAQVVSFAILGAGILSLTYIPMASALFLSRKPKPKANVSDHLQTFIQSKFEPFILYCLRHRKMILVSALALFILSLWVFNRLGGEFIPQLEEGDLAAGVMTLQGGSLSHTVDMVIAANKILLDNFPEINHAVCKIGAGEIPTDPTPMETGDYIITLKPKEEWTSAKTREELVAKMEEKLVTLAGVKFEFQQPIQMRFNELLSGSRQDIAIKVYGDDLEVLSEKAAEIEKIIRKVEGVEDINVEKVTGLGQVQVDFNRDILARYGLTISEVNRVLRAAFAGGQAGVVYDGEKRFDLVVRLDKDYRQSLGDVKSLSVALPGGGQIPLDQIARIEIKSGPAQISRENTKRRITVGFNVRNRDIQSVITEVKDKTAKSVKVPAGYMIDFGGQFQNLEEAKTRLYIAVPAALILIFILLWFTFHSIQQSLIIFSAVPLSAIGGVFALWIRGMNFSISAGIGFIALFGVAVLNGIVLIAEFNRLESSGITDVTERVLTGLKNRLRPVIMTATVASLGFMPMMLSVSAGAEVQKPLATVVFGGLISATFLTLVVLPVIYILVSGRSAKRNRTLKSMAVLLIVLIFGSLPGVAKSQVPERITLPEAIRMALDHNLAVKSAKYSLEADQALKKAAWDLPKTDFEGEYGKINSYQRDNSFAISQSLAFPTVYINQRKHASASVRSSDWRLKMSETEIVTEVKRVYRQLVFLEERMRQLKYQDSLYTGLLRAATLRAETGETNKLEMITARSQSMEAKNRYRQAAADLEIASQKLYLLLNTDKFYLPSDTRLVPVGYLVLPDSAALQQNPSVAFMNEQVEVSRLEKKLELNKMLPDLKVGYFSQTMLGTQEVNGEARTFGYPDRFSSLQAGISVPVWFFPWTARSRAAGIREEAARTNAQSWLKNLRGEYRTLSGEYSKQLRNLEYYEKQAIPEAELIIDQATRSYKAGELDYVDYILSLERGLHIKEAYLDAINDYNQTVVDLEAISGQNLSGTPVK